MSSFLLVLVLSASPSVWAQEDDDEDFFEEEDDEEFFDVEEAVPAEEPLPEEEALEGEGTQDEDLLEDDEEGIPSPDEEPPPEPVRKGPEVSVLVSEFQPVNREAAGFAALLRYYLSDELDGRPELRSIPVEEVPAFGEHSAQVYLESCPPGDQVGCAWVVAKRVGAAYGLTGEVEARADGTTQVSVTVIDVPGAREILGFEVLLAVARTRRWRMP